MQTLTGQHNTASTGIEQKIGIIIDHLIAALAGDSTCPLRRAIILTDIDQHPETTHSEIMERVGVHKSAVTRDVEWLYDHGCILRTESQKDGREVCIQVTGYSKKNIDLALSYVPGGHESLKDFLNRFMNIFTGQKPSLLQAKILAAINVKSEMSRQEMLDSLGVPASTAARALSILVETGLIEKDDDGQHI